MSDLFENSIAWFSRDFQKEQSWIFNINKKASDKLAENIKKVFDPECSLFDYVKEDFDLGESIDLALCAAKKAYFERGLTLIRGLPRDNLTEKEFQLTVWAIGLNLGVPRPQGIASQYISEVRSTVNNYRSSSGRGYNSNAGLDFHTDGCDLVGLACYNKAKRGGQSMISSSVTAWQVLSNERPDLAEVARQCYYFSHNKEEEPGKASYYSQPLFDFADGNLFGKWNWNRVRTAQEIEGVPKLTKNQKECVVYLEEILRRPDVMFTMSLEPGDLQFINNHIMFHSRTNFEDYNKANLKRLLFRIWIAPPFSVRLPDSLADFWVLTEPGTVRGGIRGHQHNDNCKLFEKRQAIAMGMPDQLI